MDDGDHEGLPNALHSHPRFLVATTLATLVIAGSAYIWRSAPPTPLQQAESAHKDPDALAHAEEVLLAPETEEAAGSSSKGSSAGTAIVVRDELGEGSEAKDIKVSRPKERRRRGKDPLKDLLKNAKKTKIQVKHSRLGDSEDSGTGSLTKINEVTGHSRGTSQAPSSRSVSSTSHRRSPVPSASPYPNSNQGSHAGDGDDEDEDEEQPTAVLPSKPLASLQPFSSSLTPASTALCDGLVSEPRADDSTTIIPLSSSSSASHSSNSASDSITTPNTSPTTSHSGKTPTLAQAEVPIHKPLSASASSPSVRQAQKPRGSWDWDGAGPIPTSEAAYRKPPRFRPKSRGSGSFTMSPTPQEAHTGDASSVSSPTEDVLFTFPSLNSSATSLVSPVASRAVNGNGNVTGNGPRRAPTPLSGTNTPPPSLSAQTQLASLRGALEAARLREEKTKGDIERYSKELDIMRWETAAWRRREVDLTAQLHQLAHQVQTYAAVFSAMSTQPQSHLPTSPNPNNSNGSAKNGVSTNSSSNTNGSYYFSPPPSNPHSPSLSLLPANGSILSPMSMSMAHPGPHSPFYPYASHPHAPHAHGQHPHAHMHQQQQSQSPPNGSANGILSMLFPHTSGPSSVAGSSSVGSLSPDLTGPSPPPDMLNRGRRRTRTQTAGARMGGGGVWDGGSDGWEEPSGDGGDDGVYTSDDDAASVSEALADAILKRPGSIRGLPGKASRGNGKDRVEMLHTEFTFPSLSDFGRGVNGAVKLNGDTDADGAARDMQQGGEGGEVPYGVTGVVSHSGAEDKEEAVPLMAVQVDLESATAVSLDDAPS
ncbi:hypothetical protein H0H81_000223 [Sphagnurus paluster]|uniref:Uncharacterized protein n=1 Tax=Sphagnurus paluster TaxID=117069 RepID=A0A9P7K4K6_9AGAR|nr:hypothetical protein H0H81_000223 [Sphagnurus paluster]